MGNERIYVPPEEALRVYERKDLAEALQTIRRLMLCEAERRLYLAAKLNLLFPAGACTR